MTMMSEPVRDSVIDFCTRIGADPLLVQGAGGNVSWKDGDTLWVKASGTALGDASTVDIFVPVDLARLRAAAATGDYGFAAQALGGVKLRPSIETMLHALMPQRVVVHLHAVEALAHLVKENCEEILKARLHDFPSWALVNYCKPGAALAEAVHAAVQARPDAGIVFLRNHGVVIGGEDVHQIAAMLDGLNQLLATAVSAVASSPKVGQASVRDDYARLPDPEIHDLVLDEGLFARLNRDWALYPDHVVFLGAEAVTYGREEDLEAVLSAADPLPELIFVQGAGIYARAGFGVAKQAQLRCYYDVVRRLATDDTVSSLSLQQVGELLNWDAEHYRQSLAKR